MSWYNPASWDWAGAFGIGSGDPGNADRANVGANAAQANAMGQAGAANYGADRAGMQQTQDYLRGQMQGQNSVSAEQLRQGLQQNLANQQSMAAGASPNNAAMAARTAAMQMGRAGAGLSGQQAVAGLQERNQAAGQLGQMQLGQSGQDVQAGLGGYGAANQGYGTALGNPEKTWGSMLGGAIGGAASALVSKSDRRAKTEIADGDGDADKALKGLQAFSYRYKDEKDGKGKQFGIMAQDLEGAGLGHAVIDTPNGKYVDGAKAATSSLALVAALGKRVAKLEGGGK